MKQLFFVVTAILFLVAGSGCSARNNSVVMSDLDEPETAFVVDHTSPDEYPSFLRASANIYSCRYGISYHPSKAYDPPKPQMFAALLASAKPGIVEHTVVLQRFDVYINERLKLLDMAGGMIGGLIGLGIEEAARTEDNVYTFEKVLIDTKPTQDRHPDENKVGCDDEQEGEYYASEITIGHDVIVTWLKFRVDESTYYFRSFYPYQLENRHDLHAALTEAIKLTFKGIAPRISGLGNNDEIAAE